MQQISYRHLLHATFAFIFIKKMRSACLVSKAFLAVHMEYFLGFLLWSINYNYYLQRVQKPSKLIQQSMR